LWFFLKVCYFNYADVVKFFVKGASDERS
jgi:hypothetical protein